MKTAICVFIMLLLAWGISVGSETADRYFDKARDLLNGGRYKEAADEFNAIVKLSSSGSEIEQNARYWIGQCHFRMGQFDEALLTFEKLIQDYPESAIIPVTQLMIARVQQEKKIENLRASDSIASDNGIIIDPQTGVKYTRIKTLAGEQDEIEYTLGLNLAPNGKFLVWNEMRVVPLDGGKPFDLVDIPAYRSSLSPDGQKVCFYSEGSIWMIPVSPETGRPTGSPGKLLDGDYWWPEPVRWSPDSEKIIFERRDKDKQGDIWILSIRDGALTQFTDDPIWEGKPRWSLDGKTIAYQRGGEIWLAPAEGGAHKKLIDKGSPISWSPDSQWLICWVEEKLRFLHLENGHEFYINLPQEVGEFLSWSSHGQKMSFYRPSYDYEENLKIVSTSGGPSFELGRNLTLWPSYQFWSPDGKMIVTVGESKDSDWSYWVIPVADGDPFPLELDIPIAGKLLPYSLSPDGNFLLFGAQQGEGKQDLWVVPVSLKERRATDAAIRILGGWEGGRVSWERAWSSDGSKIAIIHKGDVWIVYADGSAPLQITKTPEPEWQPILSPGGDLLTYVDYRSDEEMVLMMVHTSGDDAREISKGNFMFWRKYEWSPDGKELAFLSEGKLLAIPTAGGKPRQIADLKAQGMDRVDRYTARFCWSPDSQNILFTGYRKGDDYRRLFMIPAKGGRIVEFAADATGGKFTPYWSPDGKWISCDSCGMVKTRPESSIWEVDVSELLSGEEKKQ